MSTKVINIETLLDNDFKRAVTEVNGLSNLDNTTLLELYSYYKQAVIGKNNTDTPSLLDFKGQAKWSSWNKLKGMSKQTAQVKYIKLVAKITDNL